MEKLETLNEINKLGEFWSQYSDQTPGANPCGHNFISLWLHFPACTIGIIKAPTLKGST